MALSRRPVAAAGCKLGEGPCPLAQPQLVANAADVDLDGAALDRGLAVEPLDAAERGRALLGEYFLAEGGEQVVDGVQACGGDLVPGEAHRAEALVESRHDVAGLL